MGNLSVWMDNRYKLHRLPGETYELYDLTSDPSEKHNSAAQHPEIVNRMKAELEAWRGSVKKSNEGNDYPGGLPANRK
jgi:arylsulfatase A-like enzyme